MTWTPLLDGKRRDAALAALRDIAAWLADPPAAPPEPGESEQTARVANASLAMGRAGVALMFGYLALAFPEEPSYAAHARRLIADAARVMASEVMAPSLFGGFCGIAWVLQKLSDWQLAAVEDASFTTIENALLRFLEREDWAAPIELVYGLAGYLVYALARLPHPGAQRIVERSLDVFERTAEHTPAGMTWFVPPSRLRESNLAAAPNGCYNLGVAHGNPGAIAVFAELHHLGVDAPRTRRLLEESVRWLLAQELPGGELPMLAGEGADTRAARVSWCYGSPGLPLVLLRAARALDRDDWYATAVRLATHAAQKPFDASGVRNARFCHGAAGLAHQFNRLYQETRLPIFAEAASTWLDRTLAFGVRCDDPGMLDGMAGIGAALAAATSTIYPSWDAMFLLSRASTE